MELKFLSLFFLMNSSFTEASIFYAKRGFIKSNKFRNLMIVNSNFFLTIYGKYIYNCMF
jgi:hypothetical protein